jgi:hypothetical protein
VVVHHVQDDAEIERVRPVDERAQLVRRAVDMRWRVQADAVISPSEAPGNSAIGIISITVTPIRASSSSSRMAAGQVPSGVKVPTCIS